MSYLGKSHGDYECDRCGACCIHLAVQVFPPDESREGLISLYVIEADDGSKWLGYPEQYSCNMLQNDGSCQIYNTKPDCCSLFEAGSPLCQWARGKAGLGALHPKIT